MTSGRFPVTVAIIWSPGFPWPRAGFRTIPFMELVFRPITFSRRKTWFSSSSTTTSIRLRLVQRDARLFSAARGRYGFRSRHQKSHSWVGRANRNPNQIIDAEIKQAVDAQMPPKGFSKTDSDKAD